MEVLHGLDSLSPGSAGSVVTIGKFFAVHVGHQALIRAATQSAAERQAASVVLTFDRHPQEVLKPGEQFPLLLTQDERLELIASLGVDRTVVVPLDRAFLGQTPEEFVRTVLVDRLGVVQVVASDNFRFGRGAAGTVDLLRAIGGREGFGLTVVPPVMIGGERVSTSRVARCIGEGAVERAAEMLGRPYHVTGPVVEGDRLGRQIGFPTANLAVDGDRLLPGYGVYSGRARWEGRDEPAVINIGVRPTVDGIRRRVEAHLLDFSGDLYGRTLRLDFRRRLRGEQKFPDLEALQEQIARDVAEARSRG